MVNNEVYNEYCDGQTASQQIDVNVKLKWTVA